MPIDPQVVSDHNFDPETAALREAYVAKLAEMSNSALVQEHARTARQAAAGAVPNPVREDMLGLVTIELNSRLNG